LQSKLTITRCDVSSGKVIPSRQKFKASINPADIKRNYSISYSGTGKGSSRAIGKAGQSPTFDNVDAEKLQLSIVLDGTGVVEATEGRSVTEQLDELTDVVYDYVGKNHEPSVVEVSWGKMEPFYGRLTSLSIDYTLFRASGEPLRGKVQMSFTSYVTRKEEGLDAGRQSPDLTHKVRVEAGDTLPLLCKRIYDDPFQYLFVARKNGLSSFRNLAPGTVLSFPPLE